MDTKEVLWLVLQWWALFYYIPWWRHMTSEAWHQSTTRHPPLSPALTHTYTFETYSVHVNDHYIYSSLLREGTDCVLWHWEQLDLYWCLTKKYRATLFFISLSYLDVHTPPNPCYHLHYCANKRVCMKVWANQFSLHPGLTGVLTTDASGHHLITSPSWINKIIEHWFIVSG